MAKKPSAVVEKLALDHVTGLAQEFKDMTTHVRDKWLNFYRLYRLFRTEDGLPWQSKLWVARTFEIVEKVVPRLTAHNPKFVLLPKKNSAIPFTDVLADFLSYVWEEEDLKNQVRLWAKNMVIYGTGIAKVDWNIVSDGEEEVTVEVDPDTGEEFEVSEEGVMNQLPRFNLVDIFDFLVDPREEDVDSGIGVIHNRDGVDFAELLDSEDMYFNLDQVKALFTPQEPDVSQKRQKDDIMTLGPKGDIEQKNTVNLKEYWGKFSPDGNPKNQSEYVITVANDAVVIRLEKNPFGFRPFVAIKDHPVPHEFYGIGEIEPVESLQMELNWLRNQRMDNVNLVLNRMFLVDNDSGVNPSQLVSRPGNIIFKNPGSNIEVMQTPDVTSSSYREEDQINRDFQTITSTIDFTDRGGSKGFTNTATGEKIRNEEKNSRFLYKVENLEQGIREVARKMLMLTAKFSDQVIFRKLREDGGSEFQEIRKDVFDDIANGFLVKVEAGSTSADSSVDRRNDSLALFNLGANARQLGVPVDLLSLWKDVVQKGFGINNPETTLAQEPAPGQAPQGAPSELLSQLQG